MGNGIILSDDRLGNHSDETTSRIISLLLEKKPELFKEASEKIRSNMNFAVIAIANHPENLSFIVKNEDQALGHIETSSLLNDHL
jgi:hypothetical protein